jgi:mTERF domain-containing protein
MSDVGLEPVYIARLPGIAIFSLEVRIRPRYYVVKFLEENGLLDQNWGYYRIFKATDKVFVYKFICPYKKSAPHLAEDYAAACRREVPITLRFRRT